MPSVNVPAPDFELPNQDGKLIKLSNLHGKKVILFAFPQAYTGGCTAQACGFRDEFPKIESVPAVVLGISPDSQSTLKDWKRDHNLPYDLLSDPDHKVLDQWSAWGMWLFGMVRLPRTVRSVWVINENGIVIEADVGISPAESVRKALEAIQKHS
jgi:peroxiredoxin Q/BCP